VAPGIGPLARIPDAKGAPTMIETPYPIDFFLLAMPYTLLSQDALAEELPLCISPRQPAACSTSTGDPVGAALATG
jgi:hypothetical protein